MIDLKVVVPLAAVEAGAVDRGASSDLHHDIDGHAVEEDRRRVFDRADEKLIVAAIAEDVQLRRLAVGDEGVVAITAKHRHLFDGRVVDDLEVCSRGDTRFPHGAGHDHRTAREPNGGGQHQVDLTFAEGSLERHQPLAAAATGGNRDVAIANGRERGERGGNFSRRRIPRDSLSDLAAEGQRECAGGGSRTTRGVDGDALHATAAEIATGLRVARAGGIELPDDQTLAVGAVFRPLVVGGCKRILMNRVELDRVVAGAPLEDERIDPRSTAVLDIEKLLPVDNARHLQDVAVAPLPAIDPATIGPAGDLDSVGRVTTDEDDILEDVAERFCLLAELVLQVRIVDHERRIREDKIGIAGLDERVYVASHIDVAGLARRTSTLVKLINPCSAGEAVGADTTDDDVDKCLEIRTDDSVIVGTAVEHELADQRRGDAEGGDRVVAGERRQADTVAAAACPGPVEAKQVDRDCRRVPDSAMLEAESRLRRAADPRR